jgi:hypothetical protein
MGLDVIAKAIELDGGVKYLSMLDIKKHYAPYRDRLSRELCDKISAALDKAGLVTLPRTLPTYETQWVLVATKKSPIGEAISLAVRVVGVSQLGVPTPSGIHEEYPLLTKEAN